MKVIKGIVEFFSKKHQCESEYPEKHPITAWLDDHNVFWSLRRNIKEYKRMKLTDVIVKLSNGEVVRYNCCTVLTSGTNSPVGKRCINICQPQLWYGKIIEKYDMDEWETYQYIPCSLSLNLIKYQVNSIRTFLKDLFYWDTIYSHIIYPLKQIKL